MSVLVMAGRSRSASEDPRQGIVDLRVATDGDNLRFAPDHLSCPAGRRTRVHFHHAGQISDDAHNWVLLQPGKLASFIADADRVENEHVLVPPQDRSWVIAVTPMCGKGQTVTVEFVAPPPGEYPFACSVPGHGETMNGVLTVIRP